MLATTLHNLLTTGASLLATGASGEFAKGAGKPAFEALQARLIGEHKATSVALIADAAGNPTDAEAVRADLARPGIAEDAELRRLARTLGAAIEALLAAEAAPYAVNIRAIKAGRNLLFEDVEGVRADTATAEGDMTFKGVNAPGAGTFAEAAPLYHGPLIATAHVAGNLTVNEITVDTIVTFARAMGYRAPEDLTALQERADRAEADAAALRRERPDLTAEVNRAIAAANHGDPVAARRAFAEANAVFTAQAERRRDDEARERAEQARLKNLEATLLYPFEASKAEPLLAEAAELAQTNAWYWIECGRARIDLGALDRARAAFETAERIARPEHLPWDLAAALDGLGDVRVAQGDLPRALEAYEESLRIRRALADRDTGNAGWARAVLVSLNKVGDVRFDQGDLQRAVAAYEESRRIARDLVARDTGNAGWARDLSVSLNKIGDVRFAQGDLPGALEAYQEDLRIARALAGRDTGDAGWARDVSVSLNKAGDVRVAQGDLPRALEAYEESLRIRRALADRDTGNAGWARDVSVGLERVGDVRIAQGDLLRALEAYEDSLRIRRALADRDTVNAGWTRDFWVSLNKVGDVRVAQGDLPGALKAYKGGLRIARVLADRDTSNARWARDVWVSHWKLAAADPAKAAAHLAEVVARIEDMAARGILLPADAPHLATARAQLAAARGQAG